MHNDLVIKTKSLGGVSELTVLAPIRPGLVDALDSVTYKTRAKRLLGALNLARTASHEFAYFRPFSDAVERVGKIHAVRITVVEPDKLMLSVIFDGGRESYMRTLWQKVGTLLDVIFCNTVGYVTAWDHRFEAWADWVRSVQIETDYLYAVPATSVDDLRYLKTDELLRREPSASAQAADLKAVRHVTPSIEAQTAGVLADAAGSPLAIREVGRQGLSALVLMHRLTSLYLPFDGRGHPLADGAILHRATRDLLRDFIPLIDDHTMDKVLEEGSQRFDEAIRWLRVFEGERPDRPTLPTSPPQPDHLADVQGGILEPYAGVTHGCLLLIAFDDPAAAEVFLDLIRAPGGVTTAAAAPDLQKRPTFNIGFSCQGLRAIGLPEDQIELFPQEFKEGMEARASLLGDLRGNHPRRWRLPLRHGAADPAATVEMSSVHAVVQMRMAGGPFGTGAALDPTDPLAPQVADLFAAHPGVRLLSVQPLVRYFTAPGSGVAQEHFGYADAESQPVLDPAQNGTIYNRNQVQLGEFLCGYATEAERALDPGDPTVPDAHCDSHGWLRNGTFLVVRKLAQDVERLQGVVHAAVDTNEHAEGLFPDAPAHAKAVERVYAKLMGRWRDGMPLAGTANDNDFDYLDDPEGRACPVHAHIRRANPRAQAESNPQPGQRTPRLVRRSMSYGPRFGPGAPVQDRGLVFMAYASSIAEQFEVVQRWLSGGNSAGGYSGQSDPFFGVPSAGSHRHFRYEEDGKVRRVALDGSPDVLTDPAPLVRLEWGAYLFVPSIGALGRLAQAARDAAAPAAARPVPWRVADGWDRVRALQAIERQWGELRAIEAWKAALEDPEAQRRFESASVWAAIRVRCDGVLRTPFGVIVASRSRVAEVLSDPAHRYSVSGYHARMASSIGEIYLGLDDTGAGCPYRTQAAAVNAEITRLPAAAAFTAAHRAAGEAIDALVAEARELARSADESSWELTLEIREVIDSVLATLCQAWFGLLPGDPTIVPGGARWDWKPGDPVRYPGHFAAPSRFIFQPRPGATVQDHAEAHGQALQAAFGALIRRHRDGLAATPPVPALDPTAPLAAAILAACPDRQQDDLAARTMIGAMMGFLPTVDGNLRLSLNEWLRDGSFWDLRAAVLRERLAGSTVQAVAARYVEPRLVETMLLRPSPELVWRTATHRHKIGDEVVEAGDRVVVAIVSATQQCLESASRDTSPIFGATATGPRPTHACPAQNVAMAVLSGIAVALLDRAPAMRAGAAPLTLLLDGDLAVAVASAGHTGAVAAATVPLRRAGTGHRLVVAGDSWLRYQNRVFLSEQNLANHLRDDHGFEITDTHLPDLGTWLGDFYDADRRLFSCVKPQAASPRLDKLCSHVAMLVARRRPPTAIVFSAAGNDVVDERLRPLLTRKDDPAGPLNEPEVRRVVDGLMQCWLEKVLRQIVTRCVDADGKPIPVFIHGYDYPVSDDRNVFGGTGAVLSLLPAFIDAGYADLAGDLAARTAVMRRLIDRLNTMQRRVVALAPFAGHVFHADLTGTLSTAPADYQLDWDNELHPTQSGFARLTVKLVEEMVKRVPALQPVA